MSVFFVWKSEMGVCSAPLCSTCGEACDGTAPVAQPKIVTSIRLWLLVPSKRCIGLQRERKSSSFHLFSLVILVLPSC